MKFAFGVQRTIPVDDIPKGTSIVAQEFSPGKPQPTPVDDIRQYTTDDFKQNLEFTDSVFKQLERQAEDLKEALEDKLRKEIDQGLLEIKTIDHQVVMKIREKGSFGSGSADIESSFLPVINTISDALNAVKGRIIVAGHTDNVPITTSRYPSNWVLSSARAANVVHTMTQYGEVDPTRLEIRAHADILPLATNDTVAGRADNRRVEIIVIGADKPITIVDETLQTEVRSGGS
jgi:chemotaxis protein MotB